MIKIFSIEDDELYSSMIKHKLSLDPDYLVFVFSKAQTMLNRIDEYPNIIILDCRLPDMEGIELLKKIREQSPNTKVIVLSAQNSVKVTSELFGLGIFDYIIKDESALERLWLSAHKASATIEMSNEIHNLISGLNSSYNLTHTMKGASEKMDHVFSKISKTLSSNIPVSIQG